MNDEDKWQTFAERQPLIGERIEVRFNKDHYFSNNPLGTISKIEALTPGWLGIDTEYFVGAAIRLDYEYHLLPPK